MKILILSLFILGAACTKTSTGTVSPIDSAGCAVESVITGALASTIAGAITCSNSTQIASDIQTALGNVNLCSAGLSSPSVAALTAKWTKIGDVSKQDIDNAKGVKAQVVKPMGIVGVIACPIVVNTLLGYATNSIPTSWGCSSNTSAATLGATIISACEVAVPL